MSLTGLLTVERPEGKGNTKIRADSVGQPGRIVFDQFTPLRSSDTISLQVLTTEGRVTPSIKALLLSVKKTIHLPPKALYVMNCLEVVVELQEALSSLDQPVFSFGPFMRWMC